MMAGCKENNFLKKERMMKSVKTNLQTVSVADQRILDAMEAVDRKDFVPEYLQESAYVDTALPIEKGQTISQPSTVARMLDLLQLKKGEAVLEIGTGSGWNAALLAYLVNPGLVTTLEIHPELAQTAQNRFTRLGMKNIFVDTTDFRNLSASFDKIIFTAGISSAQEPLIEDFALHHLHEGGILICPFQSGPLMVLKKVHGKIEKKYTAEEYRFVPLLG